MDHFNPDMLTLAREAAGFTQSGLSKVLQWSQSKISKIEDGLVLPSKEEIASMAEKLDRSVDFFQEPGEATSSAVSFYRKTTSLPARVFKQCNARMNIKRLEIQRHLDQKSPSQLPLPHLPVEKIGSAANAAIEIRKLWGLTDGPISNLTELVEAAGCVVVHFDFGTKKLDGLCLSGSGTPFIFLNQDFPAGRMRLTLAHELGHLVMHRAPHEDVEKEAWGFAAELLMPANQIREQLNSVSLGRLAELKLKWNVSMQALLKRAGDLELCNPRHSRFMWMQMGKSGYRLQEPYDESMPRELPTLRCGKKE